MTFGRILVAVDFSMCSVAALEKAVGLAQELGASVDVVHVQPPTGSASGGEAVSDVEDKLRDLLISAQSRLGVRLHRRLILGEPLHAILEAARMGGYDLIVMGTHGRVGRLRMLTGSVAEGVVRNAPCPVLTVRVPDGEEESFKERIHGRAAVGQ